MLNKKIINRLFNISSMLFVCSILYKQSALLPKIASVFLIISSILGILYNHQNNKKFITYLSYTLLLCIALYILFLNIR